MSLTIELAVAHKCSVKIEALNFVLNSCKLRVMLTILE